MGLSTLAQIETALHKCRSNTPMFLVPFTADSDTLKGVQQTDFTILQSIIRPSTSDQSH